MRVIYLSLANAKHKQFLKYNRFLRRIKLGRIHTQENSVRTHIKNALNPINTGSYSKRSEKRANNSSDISTTDDDCDVQLNEIRPI